MNVPTLLRYIAGYLVGFFIFIVFIPFCLYSMAILVPYRFVADLGILLLVISILAGSIGLMFMLWSNIGLFVLGRGGPTDFFNITITPRTSQLVTTGPYRYTRNPMVFGAYMIYLALTIDLDSIAAISLVILSLPVAILYLRKTEEKRLLVDFGQEYEDYRRRVPMIVPWFPRD
jgi:protein-S-isoprenylcysteine O-methyltransferase Ste14